MGPDGTPNLETQVIVEGRRWHAAIAHGVWTALAPSIEVREVELAAFAASPLIARHLVVDVWAGGGGHSFRALLGGSYLPGPEDALSLSVPVTGSVATEGASSPGLIGRGRLVAGLPEEFVKGILDGFARLGGPATPAGGVSITAAGYSLLDSSIYAFRHAAALLGWALFRPDESDLPRQETLAAFLEAWATRDWQDTP